MIDQVEDLDYMLPLALRVSRDTTDIMKIHTPFHAGFGSFFRFMQLRSGAHDPVVIIQDLPNGAGGTRDHPTCVGEVGS